MKISRWILAISLVCVGFFVWRYLVTSQPLRFGANVSPEPQGFPVVVFGYFVTVAGAVLGAIYRELQVRRARGEVKISNPREFVLSVATSIDLWMSLCGSPIV